MMHKKRYFSASVWKAGIGACLVAAACRSQHPATPVKEHLASATLAGETLYIDPLDNKAIMKADATPDAKTTFCSFLVGWQDSILTVDKKKIQAREKYFQYDMQQNWIALVKGDSLHPVFFQEKPGLNSQLKEGALVFEIPAGTRPDTLVYKDSFGAWGTRLFVLHRIHDHLNRK